MTKKNILENLKKLIDAGSLPHAFLVTGRDLKSRMAFAADFAKAFFAGDPGAAGRVDNGSFEDLLFVSKDGESIRVEQITALAGAMRNKPFFAEGIMAVITEGEAMTEESQNKLLKTLEEPNPGNLILILCENPMRLRATIRSRCVLLNLESEESGELASGPEDYEAAKSIISTALFDREKPMAHIFDLMEPYYGDREAAERLLSGMEFFLRDLITGGLDPGLARDPRNLTLLRKTGRRWEKTFIKYVTIIEAARSDIGRRVNRRYCLKAMAVKFRQEIYNG